jgi:hypothetical protein
MTKSSPHASADHHFHALGRACRLPDHVTRKMVDIHRHHIERRHQRDRTIIERWISRAKADPEIGGPEFTANIAHANRALNHFGDDRLRRTLEVTGLCHHPDLIRLFVRAGKELAPKPKPKNILEIFYPNLTR